jgi:hypothetical protein
MESAVGDDLFGELSRGRGLEGGEVRALVSTACGGLVSGGVRTWSQLAAQGVRLGFAESAVEVADARVGRGVRGSGRAI